MSDEKLPEITKKYAKKSTCPPDILERIALYGPLCLSETDLAGYLGIHRKTFYNWKQQDPRLQVAWDRARATQAAPIVKKMLEQAAEGDPKARTDYLKHMSSVADRFHKGGDTTVNIHAAEGAQVNVLAIPRHDAIDAFLQENGLLDPHAQQDDDLPPPVTHSEKANQPVIDADFKRIPIPKDQNDE